MPKTLFRTIAVLLPMVAVGTMAIPSDANAIIQEYYSQAAYDAATGPQTVIDFEGIVAPGSSESAESHTFAGVTFQPIGHTNASLICGASACSGNPFGSAIYVSNFGASLDILLPAGTSAVAGFWGDLDGPGFDVDFEIYDGVTQIFSNTDSLPDFGLTGTFIGFAGTAGEVFDRIHVENSSALWIALDNFSFSATAIPEPGMLALFGLGLAGLGVARRRRNA